MICLMFMGSVLGFSRRQPRSCRVTAHGGPRRRSTRHDPLQDWKFVKIGQIIGRWSTGEGNGGVRHRHISLLAPLASNFARPLPFVSSRHPFRPSARAIEREKESGKAETFLRFSLQVRPFFLPPSPVLFFSVSSSFLCDFMQFVAKIRVLFVVCGCGLTNLWWDSIGASRFVWMLKMRCDSFLFSHQTERFLGIAS